MIQQRYNSAREMYAKIGVDTEAAIAAVKAFPISMHCWQGDDVQGFDQEGPLSGEFRQPEIIREKPGHRKI